MSQCQIISDEMKISKGSNIDFVKLDRFKAMEKTFTLLKRSSLYKYTRANENTQRVL